MRIEASIYELTGPRELSVNTEALSTKNLKAEQLLARTCYSAISPGTETAAYTGIAPLRPGKVYPRLMGYCNVAEVLATGADVKNFQAGDFILTHQSHRSHFICSENDVVAKIPATANREAATTTYLFHLGYAALIKGQIKPGLNVGIIGFGTLGATTTALAKQAGARVVVFSNQKAALKTAEQWGAWLALQKDNPDIRQALKTLTKNTGLDLIVNTSNAWSDYKLALEAAAPGGTIINLSFPGREQPIPPFNPLDSAYVYDKQLTIAAGGIMPNLNASPQDIRFTVKRNCDYLLDLIVREQLPAQALISETVPWRQLEAVYEKLTTRQPGYLTAVLEWQP